MVNEHHLEVRRTARYYTLGDPEAARELWVVCHGYRQLAGRFLRHFQGLADGRRLIAAPEALNRFYLDDDGGPHGPESRVGATWMTREDRLAEIRDYVGYLDALHDRLRERVDPEAPLHVLGFSQGAATVSRWAAFGRAPVHRLVLWAGFLPPDLELDAAAPRLRRARLTLVAGTEDGYAGPARLEEEAGRLERLGIPVRPVVFPGGHRLDAATLLELARA